MKGRLLIGFDATARSIKELLPTHVILLSMHAIEECLRQGFQVGASGYVLTGPELGELELDLKAVAMGERYLTPAVAKYAIAASIANGPKGWLVHSPS